ncbi:seryl-tRNA synthetase [Mycoplasmopsis bovigenitalium]|uniref:Serine--tRNA ligase n=2 Tax=Mycoplasmopsis bovigenitalium TaxID=2112 RepID=N9V1Z7_9BACT|nr:serine--tRNA ligase [Mycoplasmopsis bovigenitalium]ENY69407.1 Seryl-tRNA synthetase [Mycoplasmopsis bovigenitalium 51080]VEU60431.1 seryl-tRNA synthetase [Mycoplasmopsis bovigenitalium]
MLNIKYIQENKQKVRDLLEKRNFNVEIYDELLSLLEKRGKCMFDAQSKKAELSKFGKQFVEFKDDKNKLNELKLQASKLKEEQAQLEEIAKKLEQKTEEILHIIPNIALDDVPVGDSDKQNIVIATHDKLGRGLVSGVKAHHEIARDLNLVDFDRGVKLSGTRFVVYSGLGARLTRAIQNFLLDLHTENGYIEYSTPVITKPEILFGTGQLPKFKEDLFSVDSNGWYLIPTAEVTLTNLLNNEIVDLTKPQCYTAFTECFRSEAGSSGKDTKGIIRLHQFKKVELVKITNEKDALIEFEKMLIQAKKTLELLEIPFREVQLCTGDTGFSSRKTIDLEVWLPSEIKFREISSVSYMGDFQARRAMIRYRDEHGNTQYAHTMNGSGVAIDRLVAAILENYQNPDGTISVPKALIPYMGCSIIK